jgi:hypothetical protein
MKTAVDFVKANITIRKSSFSDNPQLFISILSSKSIDSYDSMMLKNISSKSFNINNNNYIVNRVQGLDCLLNGINFITGKKFTSFYLVSQSKIHPFIISCYILAGQVFSDGNHRVVMEYLHLTGHSYSKSIKYIEMIDNARRTKYLSWENIHEFIQTLISNIVDIQGEIDLNKKLITDDSLPKIIEWFKKNQLSTEEKNEIESSLEVLETANDAKNDINESQIEKDNNLGIVNPQRFISVLKK